MVEILEISEKAGYVTFVGDYLLKNGKIKV
jgi:hypothetical protein